LCIGFISGNVSKYCVTKFDILTLFINAVCVLQVRYSKLTMVSAGIILTLVVNAVCNRRQKVKQFTMAEIVKKCHRRLYYNYSCAVLSNGGDRGLRIRVITATAVGFDVCLLLLVTS